MKLLTLLLTSIHADQIIKYIAPEPSLGINLSVHHPLSLRESLRNDHEEDSEGLLKARLANFGHLEYGSSFLAKVYYPEE
jgi:hypothetical protein